MALFSWLKRGKRTPETPAPAPTSPLGHAPRYDAVEIIPDPDGCCGAVRRLAGKRILATKVPLLPLKECDRPRCACAYRRYKDRRSDMRRVSDMSVTLFDDTLSADQDRRGTTPGRRGSDKQGI